jgi:O-acetylserine/cysteine efflux transporter
MKPAHIALAIFICIIWGINFVVAKAALVYIPPYFLLACRLVLSSLVLLPFMHKPQLPFIQIFKISVTLTTLHFGLMYMALGYGLDSSVAVIIDQMRVPFAVILGYFILGETIGKRGSFGIMLALIGTFIIAGTPNAINNYYSMWMMIGAAAAWAFYNIQIKNLRNVDMLSFIGWVSLFGTPQLFIISAIFEHGQVDALLAAPKMIYVALFYISIFVTIIGHGSWYYLLQKYPVGKVVPYSLMIPVFGMVAGVIFLKEDLSWHMILGGLFTIMGVATIVTISKEAVVGDIKNINTE